jgi:flagellar hook-length control protein FliK
MAAQISLPDLTTATQASDKGSRYTFESHSNSLKINDNRFSNLFYDKLAEARERPLVIARSEAKPSRPAQPTDQQAASDKRTTSGSQDVGYSRQRTDDEAGDVAEDGEILPVGNKPRQLQQSDNRSTTADAADRQNGDQSDEENSDDQQSLENSVAVNSVAVNSVAVNSVAVNSVAVNSVAVNSVAEELPAGSELNPLSLTTASETQGAIGEVASAGQLSASAQVLTDVTEDQADGSSGEISAADTLSAFIEQESGQKPDAAAKTYSQNQQELNSGEQTEVQATSLGQDSIPAQRQDQSVTTNLGDGGINSEQVLATGANDFNTHAGVKVRRAADTGSLDGLPSGKDASAAKVSDNNPQQPVEELVTGEDEAEVTRQFKKLGGKMQTTGLEATAGDTVSTGKDGSERPESLRNAPVESGIVEKPVGNLPHSVAIRSNAPAATLQSPYITNLQLPVQSSEWQDGLAQKLVWFVSEKIQSAKIHVNPPELGPIEMKIQVSKDQAQIHIQSPHAIVRDLLEGTAQRLREMMAGQGIELTNFDVGPQGQQANGGGESQEENQLAGGATGPNVEADIPTDASISTESLGLDQLVDYYV